MVQLSQWFAKIRQYRYEDALEVTEVASLLDYILSGRISLEGKRLNQFRDFMEREMKSRGGVFHVTKDSGIFVSVHDEGE